MADEYSKIEFDLAFRKVTNRELVAGRDVLILRSFLGDTITTRALTTYLTTTPQPAEPKGSTTVEKTIGGLKLNPPKTSMVDVVADVVVQVVKQAMAPRDAKIASLEQSMRDVAVLRERMAALETRTLELEAANATANPDHVPR